MPKLIGRIVALLAKKPSAEEHDFWLKFLPSTEGYSRNEALKVHRELLTLQAQLSPAEARAREMEERFRHHEIDENKLLAAHHHTETIRSKIDIYTRLTNHFGGDEWIRVQAQHKSAEDKFYSSSRLTAA